MTKVLFIGQAPGPDNHAGEPLHPSTRSGRRLVELLGVDNEAYLEQFDRVNLLQKFPGKWARDDRFPMKEAKIAAAAIRPFLKHRMVIMLGRVVAEAFGVPPCPQVMWIARPGFHGVAVLPHPSGRNRWYSDPNNMRAARRFMRKVASL